MKLDKIKFAKLIHYITECGWNGDVNHVDELIDIDVTPVEVSGKADPALIDELMRAIHNGEKISAIKAYRSMTGFGLKEAKDAVEKYWKPARVLNERDELYVMLQNGIASPECQKDAARWIENLYTN